MYRIFLHTENYNELQFINKLINHLICLYMKKQKIILTGKSASGKSYLKDIMVNEMGYTYYKPFTTRPKRKSDNDNEYVFIDDKEFDELLKIDLLADHKSFNSEWRYGFSKYAFFEPYNVIIIPPQILEKINETNKDILEGWTTVYIDADYNERYNRLVSCTDCADDIEQRMSADEEDFCNFDCYDIRITKIDKEQLAMMFKLIKQLVKQ